MNDRLLTTREVASYLGFSPETLLRRYRAGSYRRTAPVSFASIFPERASLITTRSSCGCWTRRTSLLDIMHGYIACTRQRLRIALHVRKARDSERRPASTHVGAYVNASPSRKDEAAHALVVEGTDRRGADVMTQMGRSASVGGP